MFVWLDLYDVILGYYYAAEGDCKNRLSMCLSQGIFSHLSYLGLETPEEVSIRTISPACGKGCVLLTLGKGSVISAQPVAKDKSLYHNFAHVQVFKVNLLLGFTMTNVWMVFHTSLHYLQLFFTC